MSSCHTCEWCWKEQDKVEYRLVTGRYSTDCFFICDTCGPKVEDFLKKKSLERKMKLYEYRKLDNTGKFVSIGRDEVTGLKKEVPPVVQQNSPGVKIQISKEFS